MAVIHELSSHMADLIAAGEVVERPSSVAKELVENAIDAGASQITVEIENGGISYLRITDNGCGMSPEDAPIAFRRHATSKLRTESDLAAIGTLGFRGEALAAIASVSKIDLFTKQKGALAGTHLHLEAGDILENEDAGCPEGTTIVIRDLFYNTPARMKFLKKDFTEAGYIAGVVHHAALSHPEIAFSLRRDGKQIFTTAGDGKLITPVFGVFGREMSDNMVCCDRFERDGFAVWGYITKPHYCRPNRSMQHFFVNGRYIRSKLLQAALEEAYRNKMITGKYPSCALFLSLPLNQVDVNVHPAKTEVKFSQEKAVFQAIYIACKNTLEQNDNAPLIHIEKPAKTVAEDHVTHEQQRIRMDNAPAPQKLDTPLNAPVMTQPAAASNRPILHSAIKAPIIDYDDIPKTAVFCEDDSLNLVKNAMAAAQKQTAPETPAAVVKTFEPPVQSEPVQPPVSVSTAAPAPVPAEASVEPSQKAPEVTAAAEKELPHAIVIGEAFKTYIVAQDKGGLVLIDKHAAHERIIFNRLQKTTEVSTQLLLAPIVADMSAAEYAAINSNLEVLEKLGFEISSFGDASFAVRAIPSYLDPADIPSVLSEIADKLMTSRAPAPDQLDDLIHTVSCKAAIKAGRESSREELQSLCDRVLTDPEVVSCPHGRPTVVRLTKYELDKLFKRVNQ